MKAGREFEDAVYQFAAAVSPDAEVLFDQVRPDRDTGTPRQVDVWINTTVLGNVTLSIAVSCKDHARPLDIGEIETFAGEIASVGAHTGVLYSSSGFTRPALAKAKSLRVSCCQLYRNQPATFPESLLFHAYLARSVMQMPVFLHSGERITDPNRIRELLALEIDLEDTTRGSLLDAIKEQFYKGEQWSIRNCHSDKLFPQPWTSSIIVQGTDGLELTIELVGSWQRFRGIQEAHLLRGSYCFSSGKFLGQQSGPVIDRQGSHPGPGWVETDDEPQRRDVVTLLSLLFGPDVKSSLLAHLDRLACESKERSPGARDRNGDTGV